MVVIIWKQKYRQGTLNLPDFKTYSKQSRQGDTSLTTYIKSKRIKTRKTHRVKWADKMAQELPGSIMTFDKKWQKPHRTVTNAPGLSAPVVFKSELAMELKTFDLRVLMFIMLMVALFLSQWESLRFCMAANLLFLESDGAVDNERSQTNRAEDTVKLQLHSCVKMCYSSLNASSRVCCLWGSWLVHSENLLKVSWENMDMKLP